MFYNMDTITTIKGGVCMKFLETLNSLLYEKRMTRSDLARALDIPASTINSWFSRGCDGVALSTLVKIANYFNVSLDYLILGKEDDKALVETLTQEDIKQLKRLVAYADKLKDM